MLKTLDQICPNYKVFREGDYVFIPLKSEELPSEISQKLGGVEVIKLNGRAAKVPKDLQTCLEERIGKRLPISSYDLIGEVAIVEIKEEHAPYKQIIAECLLALHPSVKVVCAKASAMVGEYRVRKLEILASRSGKKDTETLYKEHGVIMKLDPAKVYFSPRLSFERKRICQQVRDGERVMVFFAGVGPFALVIGKHKPKSQIVGIELNPEACAYFRENIELNRLSNVVCVEGDVREKKKEFLSWADRVLMPLPKDAEHFLPDALDVVREKGVIHFFSFQPVDAPFEKIEKKVLEECRKKGFFARVIGKRMVRSYSPTVVQVVLDLEVRRVKSP